MRQLRQYSYRGGDDLSPSCPFLWYDEANLSHVPFSRPITITKGMQNDNWWNGGNLNQSQTKMVV